MTTDLKYLVFTAMLTAALWIPYIVCQVRTNGGLRPANYADPTLPRPVPPWSKRRPGGSESSRMPGRTTPLFPTQARPPRGDHPTAHTTRGGAPERGKKTLPSSEAKRPILSTVRGGASLEFRRIDDLRSTAQPLHAHRAIGCAARTIAARLLVPDEERVKVLSIFHLHTRGVDDPQVVARVD